MKRPIFLTLGAYHVHCGYVRFDENDRPRAFIFPCLLLEHTDEAESEYWNQRSDRKSTRLNSSH